MSIKEDIKRMKQVAPVLASSTAEDRNRSLKMICESLNNHKDEIFKANREDLANAEKNSVSPAIIKRLEFNEHKLADVTEGIKQLINLPDPLGKVTLNRKLDTDLILKRVTCPIGVIGVIFEARPDALVQISTLCIKSGNCAVLKGGKETANTNKVLFDLVNGAFVAAGLPEGALMQVSLHSEIDELLSCDREVDLLIPRGSNAFVKHVMDNTKIPVLGHADGICHIYIDKDADIEKAVSVAVDSKIQYPAACNAVETLLVNRDIAGEVLPLLSKAFADVNVEVRGTEDVREIISADELSEFKEYLDLIVSVKLVADVEEAVEHINYYGSHHTDCIITENDETAKHFMDMVDSAGVYRNCSTRFADGFRYGFGAEVGISTGKIHARGPVGLEGLVTYKYMLTGNGNIVEDYASGRKTFRHEDI